MNHNDLFIDLIRAVCGLIICAMTIAQILGIILLLLGALYGIFEVFQRRGLCGVVMLLSGITCMIAMQLNLAVALVALAVFLSSVTLEILFAPPRQ